MDFALKQQLRQIAAVAAPSALDAAGQWSVGSAATFFCRYEPRFREVPIYGGVEERTQHFLVIDSDFPLTEIQARDALFWLPGMSLTDATLARRAKIVHYCHGEDGTLDHIEVTL